MKPCIIFLCFFLLASTASARTYQGNNTYDNFSDSLNFTEFNVNTTNEAVYVDNPEFHLQTALLLIIAFVSLFNLLSMFMRWFVR